MVTAQQAREQIQQQRQQISETERQLQQAKARLSTSTQRELRSPKSPLQKLQERKIKERQKKELSQREEQIQQAREQLQSYEQQVSEAEKAQQEAQRQAQKRKWEFEHAVRVYSNLTSPGSKWGSIPLEIKRAAEQLVKESQSRYVGEGGKITSGIPLSMLSKYEQKFLKEGGKLKITSLPARELQVPTQEVKQDVSVITQEMLDKPVDFSTGGTVLLKPSESEHISSLTEKGISVSVPYTGEIYSGKGTSVQMVSAQDVVSDFKLDTESKDVKIEGLSFRVPEVKTDTTKYTYQPQSEMFVSTIEGTGTSGTLYMIPPTPEEKVKIEAEAARGGDLMGKAEKKIVTPVREFYSPITKPIGDIPVSGGIFKDVGDVIRDPSLAKEYFKKSEPDVVYDIMTGEARLPTKEDVEKKKRYRPETVTVGESALWLKGEGQKVGEISSLGWAGISKSIYRKAEEKEEGWAKSKLMDVSDISLSISKAVKVMPGVVQYTALTPAGGAAMDILSVQEKEKQLDKYTQKELTKQYGLYKRDYAKAEKELEEGYELEPILSRKEFEKEYGSGIQQDIASGIKREAVAPFAILATAGAFKLGKGVKYLSTPKEIPGTKVAGKTVSFPGFYEKRFPISTDKGLREGAIFKDVYAQMPTSAYYRSPFGKLFGLEPKLRALTKPQTYVYQPVENVVFKQLIDVEKPYLGRFGRVGKKGDIVNIKTYYVEQKAKDVLPKEIIKLPRREKYVWRDVLKGSDLKETSKFKMGITEQVDISKYGTGRAATYLRTDSIVTPIKKLESGAGTYRIETGMKDITKPLWRASGKIPIRRDVIIRYPTISMETTGVESFFGGGRRSSQLFYQQLYQEAPKAIIKPIIKIPKVIIKTPTKAILSRTIKELPYTVGGTGLGVIPYAGKALYERTEEYRAGIIPKISMRISPTVLPDVRSISRTMLEPKYITISTAKTILESKEKPLFRLSNISLAKLRGITELKEKQIQVSRLATKQITTQEYTQPQILRQIGRAIRPTTPRTPIKGKPPFIPKLTPRKRKVSFSRRKAKDQFVPYVRRYGKFFPVAKPTTYEKAFRVGIGKVRGTLAASLQIRKAKTKEPVPIIKTKTRKFRPAKKDVFTLVQKAPFRLEAPTEVKEIIAARRGIKFMK